MGRRVWLRSAGPAPALSVRLKAAPVSTSRTPARSQALLIQLAAAPPGLLHSICFTGN